MSAYIVTPEHIRALAVFAAGRTGTGYGQARRRVDASILRHLGGEDMGGKPEAAVASYFADVLYQENIRSVRARYPDDKWDDLPGLCVKPIRVPVSAAHMARPDPLRPVDILKMCDCLEYQSCETSDYHGTTAATLLQAIRKAAISELDGYDDAPWEYDGAREVAA